MDNVGSKVKQSTTKKKKSTKTNPPKNSFTENYDLSYSLDNSSKYGHDNNVLLDNHDNSSATAAMTSTRSMPKQRKLEIWYVKNRFMYIYFLKMFYN